MPAPIPDDIAATLLAHPSAQARIHHFTIGGIHAIALSDGGIPMPLPDHSGYNMVQLSCLLLKLPETGEIVLLDSGFGAHGAASGFALPTIGLLPAALALAGLTPADINTLLISHIHPDHIGGMYDAQGQKYFANASYHVPAGELEFWGRDPLDLSQAESPPPLKADMAQAAQRFFAMSGQDINPFTPATELRPGITAIALPGHAPAQCGFLISSQGENMIYTGDAFNRPDWSIDAPDVPRITDMFRAQAVQTRLALLPQLLQPGWRCFAPHFPFPSFGRVEGHMGATAYAPEPPQGS